MDSDVITHDVGVSGSQCIDGRWGANCENQCSDNCAGTTCDRSTGACSGIGHVSLTLFTISLSVSLLV